MCLNYKARETADRNATPLLLNKTRGCCLLLQSTLRTHRNLIHVKSWALFKYTVCTAAWSWGQVTQAVYQADTQVTVQLNNDHVPHYCWFCHFMKNRQTIKPDDSFIFDEKEKSSLITKQFQAIPFWFIRAEVILKANDHLAPHSFPSTANGYNRKALYSSRYSQSCGLLTIDPFGLRVMDLELRFE